MNTFDVLLLAAGRGSRMQSLTDTVAKPSLEIGGESLISRLAKQIRSLEGRGAIYVNLSYQPMSVIESFRKYDSLEDLKFLWERTHMGTAWSLMKVFTRSNRDLLVIHADLFFSEEGLKSFVETSQLQKTFSHIAVHKRERSKARSIIALEAKSRIVKSFYEVTSSNSERNKIEFHSSVLSNSGIYFLKSEHLFGIETELIENKSIPDFILPQLISKKQLEIVEFKGERYSVENPNDLKQIRRINLALQSNQVIPDSK
jgi:NDP-sugar pyrophosphorylase family protein